MSRDSVGLPAIAYSWFVGFAPAKRPQVAFAVLLADEGESRVRAAVLAREILAGWLRPLPRQRASRRPTAKSAAQDAAVVDPAPPSRSL